MKKLLGTLRKDKEPKKDDISVGAPVSVGPTRRAPSAAVLPASGGAGAAAPPSGAGDSSRSLDSYLEPLEAPKKSPRGPVPSKGIEDPPVRNSLALGRKQPVVDEPARASPSVGRKVVPRDDEPPAKASPSLGRKNVDEPPAKASPSLGRKNVDEQRSSVAGRKPVVEEQQTAPPLGKKPEASRMSGTSTPSVARKPVEELRATGGTPSVSRKPVDAAASGGDVNRVSRTSKPTASPGPSRKVVGSSQPLASIPESPQTDDDVEDVDSERTPFKSPDEKHFAEPRSTPVSTRLSQQTSKATKGKRKGASEGKRESFYAADKFRLMEATGRDETDELDRFDGPVDLEDRFRVLPNEVFRAFADLREVAREANTELVTPEFVVIGLAGHGKSSIVEAILGWPLLRVDFESPARRPIFISIQNNPKFQEPRFTFLPDVSLGVSKRMAFTDFKEARKEMHARMSKNKDLLRTPVHLLVEHAEVVNFNLIECPGLNPFNPSDAAISLVSELARPVHRTLIVVEECTEWLQLNKVLMQTALNLDPDCSRTLFVNSKLNTMLQGTYNTADLSAQITGMARMRPAKSSFWVTALSSKCRQGCVSVAQYRLRLAQARARDIRALRELQSDQSFESSVGLLALREHVLRRAVAQVRSGVPQIFFALQRSEARVTEALTSVMGASQSLSASRAKVLGLQYVNGLGSSLQSGLNGTLHAMPEQYGETLAEECTSIGAGWVDDHHRVVVAEGSIKLGSAGLRLIGAQQFQRLQEELHAVLGALEFDTLAVVHEFPLPEAPVSQPESQRLAAGLVDAVMSRCVGPILMRAVDRAQHILERAFALYDAEYAVNVAEDGASSEWFILAHSVAFRDLIREHFYALVAEQREALQRDLRDELLSTETYFWVLTSDAKKYAPPSVKSKTMAAKTINLNTTRASSVTSSQHGVETLNAELQAELARVERETLARLWTPMAVGRRLFAVQIGRIARNSSLKMYKFLEAVHELLLPRLRLAVDLLTDEAVSGKLFAIDSVRDEFAHRRAALQRSLDHLNSTKSTYDMSASSFLRSVRALP